MQNKLTTDINLDFNTPKTIGIVFNLILSYLKSRMSKGMIIANTNRNLESKCKYTFESTKIDFSEITNSMLLIVQTQLIINVLQ